MNTLVYMSLLLFVLWCGYRLGVHAEVERQRIDWLLTDFDKRHPRGDQ